MRQWSESSLNQLMAYPSTFDAMPLSDVMLFFTFFASEVHWRISSAKMVDFFWWYNLNYKLCLLTWSASCYYISIFLNNSRVQMKTNKGSVCAMGNRSTIMGGSCWYKNGAKVYHISNLFLIYCSHYSKRPIHSIDCDFIPGFRVIHNVRKTNSCFIQQRLCLLVTASRITTKTRVN